MIGYFNYELLGLSLNQVWELLQVHVPECDKCEFALKLALPEICRYNVFVLCI